MSRLDDPSITALDAGDMLGRIGELGSELIRAWDASDELVVPAGAGSATSIVVAGMGGSATAGDYFTALCAESAEIPVSVVRGYSLPYHVSDRTLVIASSYSGNTEESLSCYDDAWKRGAMILALTTGGQLAERAALDGVPVYRISYRSQPRAAIAHGLAPLLRLAERLEVWPIDREDVVAAASLHQSFVAQQADFKVPAAQNGPKQLAMALEGKIVVMLGAEHLSPVASRFKNQLAENAKMLAAAEILPEADHNLIVGLGTAERMRDTVALVTLESHLYHERVQRRFELTAAQFEEAGIPVHRLSIPGARILDQLLLATGWGDYASCYLAFLNGLDPTPVPQIDRLKADLG